MGFNAFVMARDHYGNKDIRKNRKEMQFIWKPEFTDNKNEMELFSLFFLNSYNPEVVNMETAYSNAYINDDVRETLGLRFYEFLYGIASI